MCKNKIPKAHVDKKKNLPLNSSIKQTDSSKRAKKLRNEIFK